jgi:L-threonylcarbamoyladenylate synthase
MAVNVPKTDVVKIDPQDPDLGIIEKAAEVIREGGLVVLPTDTVYGLVCDPGRAEAVQRIYQVKGRPRDLPLALLLHDTAQVRAYVEEVPGGAVSAIQQFWPGALTVVLRDRSEATAAVRARKDTVGLRLPAHLVPRLVADSAGCALASTSANRSGRPAPVTAEEAVGELEGLVPLALDGGRTPTGQESTVLSFASDPPRVLRAGAITVSRLREVLGAVREK